MSDGEKLLMDDEWLVTGTLRWRMIAGNQQSFALLSYDYGLGMFESFVQIWIWVHCILKVPLTHPFPFLLVWEGFAKPGILFKIKARGRLKPQHIYHMWGFQPTDNADIGLKTGFAKPSLDFKMILRHAKVSLSSLSTIWVLWLKSRLDSAPCASP